MRSITRRLYRSSLPRLQFRHASTIPAPIIAKILKGEMSEKDLSIIDSECSNAQHGLNNLETIEKLYRYSTIKSKLLQNPTEYAKRSLALVGVGIPILWLLPITDFNNCYSPLVWTFLLGTAGGWYNYCSIRAWGRQAIDLESIMTKHETAE